MSRVLPETGWQRMAGLVVHPDHEQGGPGRRATDALVTAQTVAARLCTSAAVYLASASCRQDHCALGDSDTTRAACALAVELAALAPAEAPAVTADPGQAYLGALRDAAASVYYCRRIAHPSGTCFFSGTGPHADGCGRVLAVAHRLGSA